MERTGTATLIDAALIDHEHAISLAEQAYRRHKAIQDLPKLPLSTTIQLAIPEQETEVVLLHDGFVAEETLHQTSAEIEEIEPKAKTHHAPSTKPQTIRVRQAKPSPKPVEIYSWDGSVRREANDEDPDFVKVYLQEIGRTPLLTKEDEISLAKRMVKGLDAERELNIDSRSFTRGEIGELLDVILDGAAARSHFIKANLRLVVSIAKRYKNQGLELLDLIGEGNLGLEHAVEKFEWQKGFKFSTYATWWIRQAIQRGVANQGKPIRLPVHATDNLRCLIGIRSEFKREYDREPSVEELAQESGMKVIRVKELVPHFGRVTSLQTKIGEDGETELGDLVGDSNSSSGYEESEDDLSHESIMKALSAVLDDRELQTVAGFFGFLSEDPLKHDEIADELDLTRERTRQIFQEAMLKLKHPAAFYKLDGFLPNEYDEAAWKRKAACAGADVDVMFEHAELRGRPPIYKEPAKKVLKGLDYCNDCSVKGECLEYAKTIKPNEGIWGGIVASKQHPIK